MERVSSGPRAARSDHVRLPDAAARRRCSAPSTAASFSEASIATDGVNVYFVSNGVVSKCAVTGCGGTPTPIFTVSANVYVVTTDGVNVYAADTTKASSGRVRSPAATTHRRFSSRTRTTERSRSRPTAKKFSSRTTRPCFVARSAGAISHRRPSERTHKIVLLASPSTRRVSSGPTARKPRRFIGSPNDREEAEQSAQRRPIRAWRAAVAGAS